MLGVTADGVVGPKTIAALNGTNHEAFFNEIKREREAFFRRIVAANPTQKKFLKGWLRRLDSIGWGYLKCNGGKVIRFTDK